MHNQFAEHTSAVSVMTSPYKSSVNIVCIYQSYAIIETESLPGMSGLLVFRLMPFSSTIQLSPRTRIVSHQTMMFANTWIHSSITYTKDSQWNGLCWSHPAQDHPPATHHLRDDDGCTQKLSTQNSSGNSQSSCMCGDSCTLLILPMLVAVSDD